MGTSTHPHIKEIAAFWNIDSIIELRQLNQKTYLLVSRDGAKYILKCKTDYKKAIQEIKLLLTLVAKGLQVPIPQLNIAKQYMTSHKGSNYTLCTYIEGKTTIDHYTGDAINIANLYGRAIAKLHNALKNCEDSSSHHYVDFYEEAVSKAIPIIIAKTESDVQAFLAEIIDYLNSFQSQLKALPTQLIHRDTHPQNMVVINNSIGFIDFEISVRGMRIFDLCYCGTALLSEGFDAQSNCKHWEILFKGLLDGYQIVLPLTESERQCLLAVMLIIQLLFVSYFFKADNTVLALKNFEMLQWLYNNL